MKMITDLARGRRAKTSTLQLWFVLLGCAAVAALLIAARQRASEAFSPTAVRATRSAATTAQTAGSATPSRLTVPRTAFTPTFADAAELLRAGRFAEAYGRFVTLADEGNVDAARIALVMHRYGPAVFGSAWDASGEQLAEWTQWSAAAAEQELALLGAMKNASGTGTAADGHVLPLIPSRQSVACSSLRDDNPPLQLLRPEVGSNHLIERTASGLRIETHDPRRTPYRTFAARHKSVDPTSDRIARFKALRDELLYAWDRTDASVARQWSVAAARPRGKDFPAHHESGNRRTSSHVAGRPC